MVRHFCVSFVVIIDRVWVEFLLGDHICHLFNVLRQGSVEVAEAFGVGWLSWSVGSSGLRGGFWWVSDVAGLVLMLSGEEH